MILFCFICRDDGSYLTDRVSTHLSAGPSPITADKSLFPVAGNVESWLAPGNVVWAKTPSHEWWPAEVGYRDSCLVAFLNDFTYIPFSPSSLNSNFRFVFSTIILIYELIQVMDVRDILDCTSNHHVGHVLVQLYGHHQL